MNTDIRTNSMVALYIRHFPLFTPEERVTFSAHFSLQYPVDFSTIDTAKGEVFLIECGPNSNTRLHNIARSHPETDTSKMFQILVASYVRMIGWVHAVRFLVDLDIEAFEMITNLTAILGGELIKLLEESQHVFYRQAPHFDGAAVLIELVQERKKTDGPNQFTCLDFSSDGRYLLAGGRFIKIFRWDVGSKTQKWKPILQYEWVTDNHITDVRFVASPGHPNFCRRFAVACGNGTVMLAELEKYKTAHLYDKKFHIGSRHITSIDFYDPPGGTFKLVTSDTSNSIQIWNVSAHPKCVLRKEGVGNFVRIQPGSMDMAVASGQSVGCFNVHKVVVNYMYYHNSPVHSLCWEASGRVLASVSDNSVKVWDVRSNRVVLDQVSNRGKYRACCFFENDTDIIIACEKTILRYDRRMERISYTLDNIHDDRIIALASTPRVYTQVSIDQAIVAPPTRMFASAGSADQLVKLWR